MANDNETVEQVSLSDRPLSDQIRIIRDNYSIGSGEFDALDEAADVVECNQREISRLKGERKVILKANESLAADNTRLRDELAAKDSMISEQSAVNESQAAQLRDALNECEELKCAIADLKHISDAVVKSLRDKKLEMSGEIAEKDAEIAKLRALVGELADALLAACNDTCDYCKKLLNIGDASALMCLQNHQCNVGQAYGRLVAKAREVTK